MIIDPMRPVRIAMSIGSFWRGRKWHKGFERLEAELKAAVKNGHLKHEGRGFYIATEAGKQAFIDACRRKQK